jgi:hypothetical protein
MGMSEAIAAMQTGRLSDLSSSQFGQRRSTLVAPKASESPDLVP